MAIPVLLRSQSEGEGLFLGREAEKVLRPEWLILKVWLFYDLYQNLELACGMKAISSGVGIRLYQHLDSVSLSCSVLEIGRRTYLYK